jgi:hypothetical protein
MKNTNVHQSFQTLGNIEQFLENLLHYLKYCSHSYFVL